MRGATAQRSTTRLNCSQLETRIVRDLPPLTCCSGGFPLGLGIAILLWCVRNFYVAGKGTLAPWDPPKRLVVVVICLYRSVRNPMYVGLMFLLLGWALVAGSPLLGGYALFFANAFHLRVVLPKNRV